MVNIDPRLNTLEGMKRQPLPGNGMSTVKKKKLQILKPSVYQ